MNLLLGVPMMAVAAALLWPLFALSGGASYVRMLITEPHLMAAPTTCWGAVAYWLVRRASGVLLLRAAGDKIRVRHGA